MHRAAVGVDTAPVAGDDRIDPVVVDITVEDLEPAARPGEAQRVAPVGRLIQGRDHDYIAADPLHPALEGDHAVRIMDVKDVDSLPAERWLMSAQGDEFTREPEVVDHRLVGTLINAVPVDQEVGVAVAPLFVLEELLPLKEHGDAGSGQDKAARHAGPAPGVP